MADLVGAGLVPTLVDRAGAEAVARAVRPGEIVSVYVKVNAGLGRLGVPLDEAEQFLDDLAVMPSLDVRGLYTHLPFTDLKRQHWAGASSYLHQEVGCYKPTTAQLEY